MLKTKEGSATNTAVVSFFKGTYTDILGHRGEISFSLSSAGSDVTASCKLSIFTDDVASQFYTDEESPLVLKGLGSENFKNLGCQFNLVESADKQLWMSGEFNLKFQEALPFSESAIYGTLNLKGDPGIQGGVFVAWIQKKGGEYAV